MTIPIYSRLKQKCLLFIMFCYCALAIGAGSVSSGHKNEQAIYNLLAQDRLSGSLVGMAAYCPQGKLVCGTGQGLNLGAASAQKIFVTALALEKLGPAYRYLTSIGTTGSLAAGKLSGDIIVTGSGDPSIGSEHFTGTMPQVFFEEILGMLKAEGINSAASLKLIKARHTEVPLPDTWLWQDIGNYYGAGPSGFSFMDNQYRISTEAPAKAGMPVKILSVNPEIPGMEIDNQVLSSGLRGDRSYIYGAPFSNERLFTGTLPAGSRMSIRGSMPSPADAAAGQLAGYLRNNGIEIASYSAEKESPQGVKQIGQWSSPSLAEIAGIVNKKSHNLFAEHLMLEICREHQGYQQALSCMKDMLSHWLPGAATMSFSDACGLSPFNYGAAGQYAMFLHKLRSSGSFQHFRNSLAVAGAEGTMKSWCAANGLAGKVYAKTGSITGVRSLAGYVEAKSGKLYSFCIIINNYSCSNADIKRIMEDFIGLLADDK
jgi:serine-type D-Ala-D-Ala carboxypeptidase/endopeptidase (penicillin-binding protein 4)